MRKKRILPLILSIASAACFVLSFAFLKTDKTPVVAEDQQADLTLSSFQMYNGAQIRLPVNSQGATKDKLGNTLRFMGVIDQKQYEDIEKAYGEYSANDTTEWGMLIVQRSKIDAVGDLTAENVFGYDSESKTDDNGTRKYYWTKDSDTTKNWATDAIGGIVKNVDEANKVANGKSMFTPTRYDNLDALSKNQWNTLINKNLSIDGKAGAAYYVISGYLNIPDGQLAANRATEFVGRAYVRYIDEAGKVIYKFADYAEGDIDNNSRSMTYVAQKYLESDEKKAAEDKIYVDDTTTQISHKQNNTVDEFIDWNAKTGYSIEYHFVDADGLSIMPTVVGEDGNVISPYTVVVDAAECNYTVGQLIEMSTFEIIDMSMSTDLKSVVEQYGSQIDWYNPSKMTVSNAYANGRTVFKLYYANDDYVNAANDYDVLCEYGTYDINPAVAWHYETDIYAGSTDRSYAQYDKAYTLQDDTYRPTYCAEHAFEDCVHTCDKVNCKSPNHNHVSHQIDTKLYNNTLLFSAQDALNPMQFNADGTYLSGGINFADYEYVLLRFYSTIGGVTMSLISGSTVTANGDVLPVTTGVNYEIKKGWNRIKLDGEMLQDVITAYAKAGGGKDAQGNPIPGLMKDDEVNARLAVYAPYRNGQYLQFIVDDTAKYGAEHQLIDAVDWTLYVDTTIGVKDRDYKKHVSYGGFEEFTNADEIVSPEMLASINTDMKYVYEGKKSLKLVDIRNVDDGGWTAIDIKLEKDGEPITLSELAQMEFSFQIYTTCELIIWFGGCVWTDTQPLKVNEWNTIRMSGWRMVDATLNIAKDHVAYDEKTGIMRIYFAEIPYGQSETIYIDNITATYVNAHDNVIELDDFVTLPTRTELLSAPEFITNMYAINGDNHSIDDPADVENVPYWFAIDEEVNNVNSNLVYSYEVKKNNQLSTYIDFGKENGRQRYREHSIGNMLDFYAVRAVETNTETGEKRYSDWTYYEWDEAKEGSLWNNYVVLYDLNHADTEFATPVVTLLENGVVYWTTAAGADNGYACYINGVRAYDTHRTQAFLNHGDSFSVRVITTDKKMASAHTKPVVYKGEAVGATVTEAQRYYNENGQHTDEKTQQKYDIVYVEKGESIYDVAMAQSEAFKEVARIPSTASSGGYAWKLTLGSTRYGVFLLPLTIGGQPLTNQQLLAADYVDLLVYAGANNKAGAYLSFNGTVPPADECRLTPGQWNTIRVSTKEMYQVIQEYKASASSRLGHTSAPYTNGNSPYDGSPLARLCGYALFQFSDANEGDYWIIDKASLVYNSETYRSNNASYWHTQQDYGTMPISAYNSIPPKSGYFADAIADLTAKRDKETDPDKKAEIQASLDNIQMMDDLLSKYDSLNHESLLDFYVECGVNTMMGLYDYANYSLPGHDFVINMLNECAERDMAYLIAWMGGTTFTEELLESQDAALMKEWLLEYATYAAFAGIMLTDEPGAVAYDNIVEAREAFEKYWGEDALYHVNLLPNWAGVDALLNFKNPDMVSWWEGGYTYEKYVQEYIRTYSPQVLSFDVYPIVGNEQAKIGTLLNPCDLSDNDHVGVNSTIFASNAMATEGTTSLQVKLAPGDYFNLGTRGLTYAQMTDLYHAIYVDIYNGGNPVTLSFHNNDTITVQKGWGTYEISVHVNAAIANNNWGYIYITNASSETAVLNFDNVRGVTSVGSQRYLRKGYFQNLAVIRNEALKANIPFWTYIQTTSWYQGGFLPTEEELRWNVNTALAYGAKGIQYFTGVVPYDAGGESFAGGLFDQNGNRTNVYYYAQRANMFIQDIDHILMNSRSMGVMYAGSIPSFATVHGSDLYTPLTQEENLAEIPTLGKLTNYRECVQVEGNILVGCFDYNGKTVLYVVNNSIVDNDISLDNNFTRLYFGANTSGRVYASSDSQAYIDLVDSSHTTLEKIPIKDNTTFTSDFANSLLIRALRPGEAFLVELD